MNTKQDRLAEGIVHQTMEYNYFVRIKGNRSLNTTHIKNLKESMKKKDLKIPIIINDKREVTDGQHRLQARRELMLPVYYIVLSDMGIAETQAANADNKNWSAPDFLSTYVELNYAHYKRYAEFQKKYEFAHAVTQVLLEGKQSEGGSRSNEFRTGGFVIDGYERACDWADKLYQIEPYYPGFKRRSFVLTMVHLFKNEKYNHDEFIAKLQFQSQRMVHCTTVAQYTKLIEEIYNYKRKAEDKIRFI